MGNDGSDEFFVSINTIVKSDSTHVKYASVTGHMITEVGHGVYF